MNIINDKEESKRIFSKLTEEDIKRIISVLQDVEVHNPEIRFILGNNALNAKYSVQFYNESLRSVIIEIDSNLMISYRGDRGENSSGGNSYFGYKELFTIIAEKNL